MKFFSNLKASLLVFSVLFLLVGLASAATATLNSLADFNNGTYYNTAYQSSGGFLNLTTLSTSLTGSYKSAAYDSSYLAWPLWSGIDWTAEYCYGCMLPSNQAVDFGNIPVSMSSNVLLFYFEEASANLYGSDRDFFDYTYDGNWYGYAGGALQYHKTGKFSYAINLTMNVSDRVDVINFTYLPNYTVSAWVKPQYTLGTTTTYFIFGQGTTTTTNSNFLIGLQKVSGDGWYAYAKYRNAGVMYGTTAQLYTEANSANMLNWHNVIATYDNSTKNIKFYFDGDLIINQTNAVNPGNTTQNLTIGGLRTYDVADSNLFGSLDEVAIWSTPLSAAQAKAVYMRGGPRVIFQTRGCSQKGCSEYDDTQYLSSFEGYSGSYSSSYQSRYFQFNVSLIPNSKTHIGASSNESPILYTVSLSYETYLPDGYADGGVFRGGWVYNVTLTSTGTTSKWGGAWGMVNRNLFVGNHSNSFMYNWNGASSDYVMLATSNSSPTWSTLANGTASDIDTAWGYTVSEGDSGTNTFNANTNNFIKMGGTYYKGSKVSSYDSNGAASWKTMVLKLGAISGASSANRALLVFATNFTDGGLSYAGDSVNYQMLLPDNNENGQSSGTTYYFYVRAKG